MDTTRKRRQRNKCIMFVQRRNRTKKKENSSQTLKAATKGRQWRNRRKKSHDFLCLWNVLCVYTRCWQTQSTKSIRFRLDFRHQAMKCALCVDVENTAFLFSISCRNCLRRYDGYEIAVAVYHRRFSPFITFRSTMAFYSTVFSLFSFFHIFFSIHY